MSELLLIGKNAKEASYDLGVLSTKEKDNALLLMAEELVRSKSEILDANKVDLENAKEKGISEALLDRLALSNERIEEMANGLREIVKLQDPVGEVISMWQRPNGIHIGQKEFLLVL